MANLQQRLAEEMVERLAGNVKQVSPPRPVPRMPKTGRIHLGPSKPARAQTYTRSPTSTNPRPAYANPRANPPLLGRVRLGPTRLREPPDEDDVV
jgi:hypothetical protein